MKPIKPLPPDPSARRARLDAHAAQAEAIILARQDAGTGLLPASTAITVHGDYTHAWVRDNVYSILGVWGLGLAYRAVEPARAEALLASVVRLMRGLLAAMAKQAHKVERFKHTQHPMDALHAKVDTRRGEPVVGDADWGHLQLDATALFVLQLAQMSASGLAIVQTRSEVAFVQNLVHYLAKAYRTPDYGIWERGHKRNEGRAELNASSLGMAKAALEAIDGVAFLPGAAPAIHVMDDDIAHARETLAALLPRESQSKETDAALLSIVGYPAFAVEDAALEAGTRSRIAEKLHGRYGCKRFLRDGHQTALEDHGRLYYEPGELARFEHIESEWPLFFTYLLLDAVLGDDAAAATELRTRLDALRCERDGQLLLPELYLVPADAVDAERARPHSQDRVANDNVPLVWAQSLYLLGVLLHEGHLSAHDIDPLGRHLRRAPPPAGVRVAVLADSELVRSRLAAHGIAAQTAADVAPLQVREAHELEALLASLGADASLGLGGRPAQGVGPLATSRVYVETSAGADVRSVFLPPLFSRQGFYLALDNRLLVAQIDAELAWLRRHWRQRGDALLLLRITDAMLDAAGAEGLIAHLAALAAGQADDVRFGLLGSLAVGAATQRVDWPCRAAPAPAAADRAGAEAPALPWDEAATRPLTAARAAALEREPDGAALRRLLARSRNPYEQIELLALLQRRDAADEDRAADRALAEAVHGRACTERRWGVVRRAAAVLGLHDATLEDAVAQLVMRGKRVAVGRAYSADAVLAAPLPNAEIVARIEAHGGADGRGRVLIEEIVLLLAMLIKAEPSLFAGTSTLRAWHLLLLVTGTLAREHGVTQGEAMDHLQDLSPHAIAQRLRELIAREQDMSSQLVRLQSLHHSGDASELVHVSFPASGDPALPGDHRDDAGGGWLAWREMTGSITRLPADFYSRVWELLQHCSGLVIGDQLDSRNCVVSALARADMTAAEAGFALHVEDLLNKIQAPEYRQLSIEALLALSDIANANASLLIDGPLVLDVVVGVAVRLAWQDALPAGTTHDYNDHRAAAWAQCYASPPHRVANFVMAALALLLQPAEAPVAADDRLPDESPG